MAKRLVQRIGRRKRSYQVREAEKIIPINAVLKSGPSQSGILDLAAKIEISEPIGLSAGHRFDTGD